MNDPKTLTPAEIPAFIAQLRALGYTVVPPVEVPAVEPVEIDWNAEVRKAQELVDRLREAEGVADQRCMDTPLDDRDLGRYRQEATHITDRLADAEDALSQALADRKLMTGR